MREILVDCDPGWDDAIALMLLLVETGRLHVRVVGAVHGNRSVEETCRFAGEALELCGRRDIPLGLGAARPLCEPPPGASTWIDSAQPTLKHTQQLPLKSIASEEAYQLYAQSIVEAERPITLVALGPLTNVARLLMEFPGAISKIEQIVLLGGAVRKGNVTPVAEFNFFMDAKAASIVVSAPIPKTIIPADIAAAAPLPPRTFSALKSLRHKVPRAAVDLIEQYSALFGAKLDRGEVAIYDAFVPILLLRPNAFSAKSGRADVISDMGAEHGKLTFVDDRSSPTRIVTAINSMSAHRQFLTTMSRW